MHFVPISHGVNNQPLNTYEDILLTHFAIIGQAMQKTERQEHHRYCGYLVDKFACHSSSLYHIMRGFIEHRDSDSNNKKFFYDLFSINALIRGLIETYITFHHLWIYPKSEEEMYLRFLLWKLDGIWDTLKVRVSKKASEEVITSIGYNLNRASELCEEIEKHPYYLALTPDNQTRLYDSKKRKSVWKFTVTGDKCVQPLHITALVDLVCVTEAFSNTYRYTSMHTHSGFRSLEDFEKNRGKLMSTDYIDPLIRQAIYTTLFMIKDITRIDNNALNVYQLFPRVDKEFIDGINKSFRQVD